MDIQNVSKIGINYIFRQRKYLGTSIRIRHVRYQKGQIWWCRQLRLAFCQHLEIHRSQNCWKVTELALILKKMFQSIINIQEWQNGGTKDIDWLNRLSGVSYCYWLKQSAGLSLVQTKETVCWSFLLVQPARRVLIYKEDFTRYTEVLIFPTFN